MTQPRVITLVLVGGPWDGVEVECDDSDHNEDVDHHCRPETVRFQGQDGWYAPTADPDVYRWVAGLS